MKLVDLPKEITNNNLKEFQTKAKEIRDKFLRTRLILVSLVLYFVPTALSGVGIFYVIGWLAVNNYLNFLPFWFGSWASAMFFLLIIIVLAFLWIPLSVFYMLTVTYVVQKYLGLPSYEEMIFAECFTIAEKVKGGKRVEAQGEANFLRSLFTSYARNLVFNPKRKAYSPELDVLRSGRTEMSRMILFSKKDISRMFMRVGLAFAQNDDPEAFESLTELINEVRKFGEPKGRLHRLLGHIERYPVSLPWLVGLVIPLTTLAILLYYLLSGQKIPFPAT
jgi:hypothetical protein